MRISFSEQLETLKERDELFPFLVDLTTLEGVFKLIRENLLNAGEVDLLPQDEFSHDVIIHLPDTGEYLVFGCT